MRPRRCGQTIPWQERPPRPSRYRGGMRCDQCDSKITGTPVKTATRTLCKKCGDRLDGLAAGMVSIGS